MDKRALVVFLGETILVGLVLFLAYKISQHRHRKGRPVLKKMLSSAGLISIWALVVLPQPFQLWQRILAAFSAQYGLLLYYCALDQMLSTTRRRPVIRSKAFAVTTLIVGIVVILDFHLGTQLSPLEGIRPSTTPTWTSVTESALNYFGLLYVEVLIVWVYVKDLRRSTDLIYASRRSLCILAFLVNILGLLLLEGTVLRSLFVTGGYSVGIGSLYLVSLALLACLLAGGYMLPDRFFATALRPIYTWLTVRQKCQHDLLHYLHQTMLQIVPSVHLDCPELYDLRVLIEISDARQVIWSQDQRTRPLTPKDEATHLLQLIRTHTAYEGPGIHEPPPTHHRTIVTHNLAVAKQLKRLQKALAVSS